MYSHKLTITDMDTQKNARIVGAKKSLNMENVEGFASNVEKLLAYKRARLKSLEELPNNGF